MNEKIRDEYLQQMNTLINETNLQLNQLEPNDKASSMELKFKEINAKYLQVVQIFSDVKADLPSYNLKKIQESLNLIKSNINFKKNICLPQKKFVFNKKYVKVKVKKKGKETESPSTQNLNIDFKFVGFKNKSKTELTLNREESNKKDLQLIDLDDCQVKIFGNPSSISINNCKKCFISIGPVSGSIFVQNCDYCKFQFMCHQLRVHKSHDCHFYTLFTSRSVIEESNQIKFSKYSFNYDDINKDIQQSGLDVNQLNSSNVDDFDWLAKDKPSPNWSLV